eukprot:5816438-Amphidinium_carterae.1
MNLTQGMVRAAFSDNWLPNEESEDRHGTPNARVAFQSTNFHHLFLVLIEGVAPVGWFGTLNGLQSKSTIKDGSKDPAAAFSHLPTRFDPKSACLYLCIFSLLLIHAPVLGKCVNPL